MHINYDAAKFLIQNYEAGTTVWVYCTTLLDNCRECLRKKQGAALLFCAGISTLTCSTVLKDTLLCAGKICTLNLGAIYAHLMGIICMITPVGIGVLALKAY